MKKSYLLSLILMGIVVSGAGCTAVVRPSVSPSEFMSDKPKILANVALHITEEFKNYSAEHFDWWCDGTKYKMEIGPFATDWFRYALENRFADASIAYGMPEFPYSESGTDFIITPKFTTFKAGGPVLVKIEKYWIELGMDVTIQDSRGQILETLQLQEKGAQAGTLGVNPGVHLYPNICRLAVKPLVEQTIEKIAELHSKK
jgi:hypothetical protein